MVGLPIDKGKILTYITELFTIHAVTPFAREKNIRKDRLFLSLGKITRSFCPLREQTVLSTRLGGHHYERASFRQAHRPHWSVHPRYWGALPGWQFTRTARGFPVPELSLTQRSLHGTVRHNGPSGPCVAHPAEEPALVGSTLDSASAHGFAPVCARGIVAASNTCCEPDHDRSTDGHLLSRRSRSGSRNTGLLALRL